MPRVDPVLVGLTSPPTTAVHTSPRPSRAPSGRRIRHREIIVVDDSSADDTPAPAARSAGGHLHPAGSGGRGAARNRSLAAARGDHIALLDHDDLWAPEKLAVQVAVAARRPTSDAVVCDGVEFDGSKILSRHLLAGVSEVIRAPAARVTRRVYPQMVPGAATVPRPDAHSQAVATQVGFFGLARRGDGPGLLPPDRTRVSVTFHDHSLSRWRYLPTSYSWPPTGGCFDGRAHRARPRPRGPARPRRGERLVVRESRKRWSAGRRARPTTTGGATASPTRGRASSR